MFALHRRAPFRASPRVVVGVALATVLASGAVALVANGADDDVDVRRVAIDTPAIAAYVEQIERLSDHGGQIVVDGIKPGIADITQRTLPNQVLERMARGWVASMDEVRRDIAAIDAPGALVPVAVRFERALVAYVRTAEALVEAATATGALRAELIDQAISLGGDADRLYDEARESLAALARVADLEEQR